MTKKDLALLILFILLSSCTGSASAPTAVIADSQESTAQDEGEASVRDEEQPSGEPESIASAGESFTTFVPSAGIGNIAIQVALPDQPRYADGAGIVVEINTYLTPQSDFYSSVDLNAIGLIHISYLWPGVSSPSGIQSDGVQDFGGELSIQALRDVIRFASGQIPNHEDFYLNDLIAIDALHENLGLYAFSHPGLAAVNVLALYGEEISKVDYFVGRENPTLDKLTAVEVGYFDNQNRPVLNPLYQYTDSYRPRDLLIDYSSIAWDAAYTEAGSNWVGVPYFDLNANGVLDASDHVLGTRVPSAFGKRLYSGDLLSALQSNPAFAASPWPEDLASLEMARSIWSFQDSPPRYPLIGEKLPDLKIMLVFARFDHIQPAADKPHIHQAYEGFHFGAGLWVRLNPDEAYVSELDAGFGAAFQENAANQQPANWSDAEGWGYPNQVGSAQLAPLAAIAEMADRVRDGVWTDDLDQVLYANP